MPCQLESGSCRDAPSRHPGKLPARVWLQHQHQIQSHASRSDCDVFSMHCSMPCNVVLLVAHLQDPAPDVRAGDIYALLVRWCCEQGNMPQALQLLQQMAEHGLHPGNFVAEATLLQVQQVRTTGSAAWSRQSCMLFKLAPLFCTHAIPVAHSLYIACACLFGISCAACICEPAGYWRACAKHTTAATARCICWRQGCRR